MSNPSNFDDAVLTDVLDGLADTATVAAVQADPVAVARLAKMRAVQRAVATPPSPPSAERRSRSIAAALAAAEPTAGVTSLATARQSRVESKARVRRQFSMRWAAAAAAALALGIGVPAALSTIDFGSDSADVASSADSGQNRSTLNFDEGDSSADATGSNVAEVAPSADAMADDADADVEAGLSEPSELGSSATTLATSALDTQSDQTFASVDELLAATESRDLSARFAADDPIFAEREFPACFERFSEDDRANELTFNLAFIETATGARMPVLVFFDRDGTVTILDAEDCSPVR